MGRLFGTDGIRGIVGGDLNSALAKLVGRALIRALPKNKGEKPVILIGMDTRLSSFNLLDSVIEGICEGGGDAINVDVCPTSAVAYLLRKYNCDAGVMISASHNPWEYNGIKIFGSDGFKISDEIEDKIEKTIEEDEDFVCAEKQGYLTVLFEGIDEYIDYLSGLCECSLSGLRIGIDCANGSASVTAEKLFKGLGAECFMISDSPDGININDNCGSTHTDGLKRLVVDKKLDAGVAFDGDADRCILIDENGSEIDGDFILAILAKKLGSEGRLTGNTLVGTVMSNIGLVKFCRENDIDFLATKVGDRYVLEAMNERGLTLGGEQSGHIIMREFSTTGDGQLTAICVLSHIKKSGKSLSTLATVMKKYPQYILNIVADSDDKKALKTDPIIKEIIAESEKEMGTHGRILIRPSGTESLIRIMTEGDEPEMAQSICKRLAERIGRRIKELNQPMG